MAFDFNASVAEIDKLLNRQNTGWVPTSAIHSQACESDVAKFILTSSVIVIMCHLVASSVCTKDTALEKHLQTSKCFRLSFCAFGLHVTLKS